MHLNPAPRLGRALDQFAARATGSLVVTPLPSAGRRPSVSVVIPCYNYGSFLPSCVATVLDQPGVDLDVIIVDDASPDGSAEVAESLAESDARIRLIRHLHNRGHIATYNDGIDEAQGDYVVLLSADDLLTPGSLSRATALLEAHPAVGFAYGDTLDFSGDYRPVARERPRGWAVWPGRTWLSRRFRTSRNVIRTCEVVMRATVQRQVGGYRPELPQLGDLDMWMRAASVADVGYVVGADQAWYRLHNANMHATLHEGRRLSGVLRDLEERLLTFELLAEKAPDPDDLSAAHRALALEALRAARRAYTFGTTDHAVADKFMPLVKVVARGRGNGTEDYDDVERLVQFAKKVDPSVSHIPEWSAVRRSRDAIGTGRSIRSPYYLGLDAADRATALARRWPWQRLGS